MLEAPIANVEMARAWDGQEGDYWTVHADRYEASTQPLWFRLELHRLITPLHRVLDVGCGTGRSTIDAATLASAGFAVGVDLSSRMRGYARERARAQGVANVEFRRADAQVHPFAPASFDVVISLFGAMFFNDPVTAFTNINRALTGEGRLALLAWRPLEQNEWLLAIREALAMGRTLPEPPPDAPGPFGLAHPDTVHEVLEHAGFVDVDLTPVDEPVRMGADTDDACAFLAGMGVVRGLTEDLDEAGRREALDRLRRVMAHHEAPEGVFFGSAAWLITARGS